MSAEDDAMGYLASPAARRWHHFCWAWLLIGCEVRVVAAGGRKPELCSICRRVHGSEVVHACE